MELIRGQGSGKVSGERLEFAGLRIGEEEIGEVAKMSLKEYLSKVDAKNFRIANGLESGLDLNEKKRKYGDIAGEDDMDVDEGAKKKSGGKQGCSFLDVGSVSWSMLLACFFLQLHDDRKSFYISIESIKEMLGVLKAEFKEFVPFEND
jgi:hypothetical protein